MRTRKHKTRVRVKLKVDTPAKQSPNPPNMAKLKLIHLAQKGEDKTVIWLAWALAKEDQCLAITCEADFPDDIEGFRRCTDRLRPQGGRATLWFVLLIACDGNPDNMTFTVTSTMNWWHKDNHSACCLHDVQDSDDAVEAGTLACDHFRLARVPDPIFWSHNGGARLKFGVSVKMSKGCPKNEGNFNFPKDRLAVVLADHMDSQPVRTILCWEFNCHPNPLQRPGQCDFCLVPAPDMVSLGSNAHSNWERMQQKHSAVLDSLVPLCTTNIKDFDLPCTKDGFTCTLREIILDVRHPLGSDSANRLCFLCDKAVNGGNLPASSSILTAHTDWHTAVEALLQILPAHVSFWVGNQAAKKWLHPQAIAASRGVELTLTNTGTWDGQWSTEEDAIDLDILEEDMGAPVVFDFLSGALSQRDEPTILTTDDATVHSFSTQLNGSLAGQQTVTQDVAEATLGGLVTPTE